MELDEIKNLIELLKDTDISEIQIEREGAKLKLKREKFLSSFDVSPPPTHTPAAEPATAKEESRDTNLITISSPIVGMFFRSSSPDTEPFVEVGSNVKKGQVLCIVEAMKLMNEIDTDTDGVVMDILVENGHPVEYGEPLFLIKPAS
jgi:acetyl-CoA carboxylase biotin carboxyl carrier protein